MGVMGKKKSGPARDKHKPAHMVRLRPDLFGLLKALADEGNRPLTRELQAAVIAWLEQNGRWPPPGGQSSST